MAKCMGVYNLMPIEDIVHFRITVYYPSAHHYYLKVITAYARFSATKFPQNTLRKERVPELYFSKYFVE